MGTIKNDIEVTASMTKSSVPSMKSEEMDLHVKDLAYYVV